MCYCHKGENNCACDRGCKDCLLNAEFFLMQLSVALGLHFGWGAQSNTSEMFWIDISRWMISSRCRWISVYLFWRTSRAFEPLPFFCSIVSIAVRSKSCRLPFCNLFTSHSSFIVFWERDITSEHHVSRSISLLLFQTIFTFLLLLAIIVTCVLPFVNNKTGEIDNLSELRWEQSYLCLCAGPGQGSNFCLKWRHCFLATYLSLPESYEFDTQPWCLHQGKSCCCPTSHLPLGIYQRRARNHYHHLAHQAKILAPLPGTPSAKIGELHTTLYLCFLVLLVYLSVFIFVSYMKNQKKLVATFCLFLALPCDA